MNRALNKITALVHMSFHRGILHKMAKKLRLKSHAHSTFYCSWNSLYRYFLIAVAVFLKSLLQIEYCFNTLLNLRLKIMTNRKINMMVVFLFLLQIFPDSCRSLKFASPVDGFALEGHVIKTISLHKGMSSSCLGRCSIESTCMSFNIGPPIDNHVICQLSNSDHMRHPGDLKPQEGFTYRATEVRNQTHQTLAIVWFFSFKPFLSARMRVHFVHCNHEWHS